MMSHASVFRCTYMALQYKKVYRLDKWLQFIYQNDVCSIPYM